MANGALKPFEPGKLNLPPPRIFIERAMSGFKCTRAEAKEQLRRLMAQEIWTNDEYQVNIDRNVGHGFGPNMAVVHVSIKTLDKRAVHDWRDMQAIKNMLIGPQHEAIELYPAESRLVDTANQYHLFVLMRADGSPYTVPLGFMDRAVDDREYPNVGQRKFASAG